MGKVRVRLWLHKLNNMRIKGIRTTSIKRPSPSSPPSLRNPSLISPISVGPRFKPVMVIEEEDEESGEDEGEVALARAEADQIAHTLPLSPLNHKAFDIPFGGSFKKGRSSLNTPPIAHNQYTVILRSPVHRPHRESSSGLSAPKTKNRRAICREDSGTSAVGCGCQPSLAASFRKTKENLQSFSHRQAKENINIQANNSAHYTGQARKNLGCDLQMKVASNEKKSSKLNKDGKDIIQKRDGYGKDVQSLGDRLLLQKIRREGSFLDNMPGKSVKGVGSAQEGKLTTGSFRLSTSSSTGDALTWEKEYSFNTSTEDTFLSSFERGRTSLSSNSSAEVPHVTMPTGSWSIRRRHKLPEGSLARGNGDKLDQTHSTILSSKFESNPGNGLSPMAAKESGSDNGFGLCLHNPPPMSHHWTSPSLADNTNCNNGTNVVASSPWQNKRAEHYFGVKEDVVRYNEVNRILQGRISTGSRSSSSRSKRASKERQVKDADTTSSSEGVTLQSQGREGVNRRRRRRRKRKSCRRGGSNHEIQVRGQSLEAKWQLSTEPIQWQTGGESSSTASSSLPFARRPKSKEREAKLSGPPTCSEDALVGKVNAESERGIGGDAVISKLPASNSVAVVKCSKNPLADKVNVESERGIGGDAVISKLLVSDSVAVVKCSKNPLADFRDSMVDMVLDRHICSAEDLAELLQCFLALNTVDHHGAIVKAFTQVWEEVFDMRQA